MRCSSRFADIYKRISRSKYAAVLLFVVIFSTSTLAVHPTETDTKNDIKKLIKEAAQLTRAGLLPEAEVKLRKAAALDEKRTEAKVELCFVLVKQRRLLEANDLCFPIAVAEPNNARVRAILGAMLLTAGMFQDARMLFYAALALDKKQHLAWAGYGMVDFYENRLGQSYGNLREAAHYAPDEPDYAFALAQVSARAELYREAAAAYRKFLDISKSTDSDRRARIQGLISFLEYLGSINGLYVTQGSEQTKVAFDLEGNRPVITVKVNDKQTPLRFVLDTGSGISVISEETAKRLKIKPITRGGYARGVGGDGKFEIIYGFLKKVGIGEVDIRNVPVYIRPFHSDARKVDGYIGLALISKFLTTIDYGGKTFSLTRREIDRQEFTDGNAESLPLRLTSSGFLSGQVEIPGIDSKLNFIVDTGASVSVISERVSRVEEILPYSNSERLTVIGAAGVTEDVPTFLLPKVTFGKHSRESIMAIALNLDIINEASGFEQAGILGGNFLKNYKLTFDFRNAKVTFVPVKVEKE